MSTYLGKLVHILSFVDILSASRNDERWQNPELDVFLSALLYSGIKYKAQDFAAALHFYLSLFINENKSKPHLTTC